MLTFVTFLVRGNRFGSTNEAARNRHGVSAGRRTRESRYPIGGPPDKNKEAGSAFEYPEIELANPDSEIRFIYARFIADDWRSPHAKSSVSPSTACIFDWLDAIPTPSFSFPAKLPWMKEGKSRIEPRIDTDQLEDCFNQFEFRRVHRWLNSSTP